MLFVARPDATDLPHLFLDQIMRRAPVETVMSLYSVCHAQLIQSRTSRSHHYWAHGLFSRRGVSRYLSHNRVHDNHVLFIL